MRHTGRPFLGRLDSLWLLLLVGGVCQCTRGLSVQADSAVPAEVAPGNVADGARVDAAVLPDAAVIDAAADAVDAGPGGADASVTADACVPIACALASGYSYCGRIGDGCGGALSCSCPVPPKGAGPFLCSSNTCLLSGGCTPFGPAECDLGNGYQMCGLVGDGCLSGNVDCGGCKLPGWECVDRICVGSPAVCSKRQDCDADNGDKYCGIIGDGCGGNLQCDTTCPLPGWICQDNICTGPSSVCAKVSCRPATGGQYCGDISDGCGGTLECGPCEGGAICGAAVSNVCGANGEGLAPPRAAPEHAPAKVGSSPEPLPPPPPPVPPGFNLPV
jgi:hypothetical protein